MHARRNWTTAIAALLLAGGAGVAHAAPCANLPGPIYVAGSTAVQAYVQAIGTKTAGTNTLIYQKLGSCVGVNDIIADTTPTGACAQGACITGTGTYWDANGAMQMCDLDANGQHLDVAVSDVFVDTCTGMAAPATLHDFVGPAQAMEFVVPKSVMDPIAITREEGYFAFGFGSKGMADPWTDPTLFFIRNSGSGTQQIIGHAITVLPVSKMQGMDAMSSGNVASMVAASPKPAGTIGICGAETYDPARDKLNALAFRAKDQYYAYFADSTPSALDKKNVRDGHYLPFGYVHMDAWVDNNGAPLRAGAKTFTDIVLGKQSVNGANYLDVAIGAHTVPQCAMTVSRTADGGDLSLYSDPAPCSCYFDKVATGATSCTVCTMDGMCNGGKCRNGYCEAK
jgi:hypothetical protein